MGMKLRIKSIPYRTKNPGAELRGSSFMHEYFHQIEYKTTDNAFRDLALKEFFMPNWGAYAHGSYTCTDLSMSLMENAKREALKEQARILYNSGYSSLAISTQPQYNEKTPNYIVIGFQYF
jgi:hypothetical protein